MVLKNNIPLLIQGMALISALMGFAFLLRDLAPTLSIWPIAAGMIGISVLLYVLSTEVNRS